jgi:hypothetical protein
MKAPHIRPNDAHYGVLPKSSHNPQQYPVKCVVRGPLETNNNNQ